MVLEQDLECVTIRRPHMAGSLAKAMPTIKSRVTYRSALLVSDTRHLLNPEFVQQQQILFDWGEYKIPVRKGGREHGERKT